MKKNKNKKKFIMITAVYCLGIFYALSLLFSQQISLNKYNSQIEMYSQEINNKNDEISLYQKKEENINNDEYIEEIARKSLGLVKPYEKVFIDVNK